MGHDDRRFVEPWGNDRVDVEIYVDDAIRKQGESGGVDGVGVGGQNCGMAILVFQHEPMEHAAQLGDVLTKHGHTLRVVRFYDGGQVPNDLDDVDGLVIMGGNMNVDETEKHPYLLPEMAFIKRVHEANKPVIGVCLGAQLIAVALGGEVGPMDKVEIGFKPIKQSFFGTIDTIYAGIPWDHIQFHWHGQEVKKTPPGGTPLPLTGSAGCKVQSFKVGMTTYGFQYHFEYDRAELEEMFTDSFIREHVTVEELRAQVDQHYENYRRLGDRLCERLAMCLFPVSRRVRSSA